MRGRRKLERLRIGTPQVHSTEHLDVTLSTNPSCSHEKYHQLGQIPFRGRCHGSISLMCVSAVLVLLKHCVCAAGRASLRDHNEAKERSPSELPVLQTSPRRRRDGLSPTNTNTNTNAAHPQSYQCFKHRCRPPLVVVEISDKIDAMCRYCIMTYSSVFVNCFRNSRI